jgi:putative oxidoreductase
MHTGWGIVPLRVVVGVVFAMHGGQKLFGPGVAGVTNFFTRLGIPMPDVAAPIVIGVELFGGLALLLGLGTRIAGLLLAADMLVALLKVHLKAGFFLPGGYEFVLTLLAACVTLALTGPGRLSIEAAVGRKMF